MRPLTFFVQCPDDLQVTGYDFVDRLLHMVLAASLVLAQQRPVDGVRVAQGNTFGQRNTVLVLGELPARV